MNQLIKPSLITTSSSPVQDENSQLKQNPKESLIEKSFEKGTRYLIVDCGGGTVDCTVHEVEDDKNKLKEIYYGGGPFGNHSVINKLTKVF